MANVNVSLKQLRKHGITPDEMLAYVEEVAALGLNLSMRAQHPDELKLLEQVSRLKRTQLRIQDRRQFLSLIALGSIGALGTIVWGLSMM